MKAADSALRRDIEDARALRQDLQALLKDAEDVNANWTIYYAVDFAEIHSYIFPHEGDALRIFRDDSEFIGQTIQDNALQRVLFDIKPVLLPPYFLELDTFLDQIHPPGFNKMATSAAHVVQRAQAIAALPEFAAARESVDQFRRNEGSEQDIEELRKFIERHADLVAAMKSSSSTSPAQRLSKLLGSGRFVDLEELVGETLDPDRETYDDWRRALDDLRKSRSSGSNRLDALAIALVKSANQQLLKKRTKLRLVTRSTHMHRRMNLEVSAFKWSETPLRHPRCFGVFLDEEWTPTDAVGPLRELLTSVEAFLDAALPVLKTATRKLTEDDPVRRRLNAVKDDWRRAFELSTIARKTSTPNVTETGVREFIELIDVVNHNGRLRNVLRGLSRELYEEIPKAYQLLGLLVQGRGAVMRKLIEENDIEATPEADLVVLSSTRDTVPYRLEFYSDELRSWTDLFGGKLNWETITRFFVHALESKADDYEVLLALAYLLCATGNWAATEKYCRLALAEPDAKANPHEGLFLLAFALRRQAADLGRYEESLKTIDAAIKAKLRGERGPADPRYLKEKATLILIWWRRHRLAIEGKESAFEPPAISEPFALGMYTDALAHPEADDDLKAQIYNNLVMVMLGRDDDESREQARKYLHHLMELRPIDGDVWRGSALILDTILWGGWKLGECKDDEQLARQIKKVEKAARARGISEEEKAQIREHIAEMSASRAHPAAVQT